MQRLSGIIRGFGASQRAPAACGTFVEDFENKLTKIDGTFKATFKAVRVTVGCTHGSLDHMSVIDDFKILG